MSPARHPSSPSLRIGVSGHRVPPKLPEESEAPLRAHIDRILAAIAATARKANTASALVIVSSLAEGSDRIVAAAGLAAGFALQAVLPFEKAEYERDFETQMSRREFEELLARACDVFELDGDADERPRAYEAAGLFMLANIDVLVAIWDGEVAAGIGGTAQIVERAIAEGIAVVWIEPNHPNAMQISRPGAGAASAGATSGTEKHVSPGRCANHSTRGRRNYSLRRRNDHKRQSRRRDMVRMNDASAATFENSRDRHLFGPGPKRVLALDGGGVRGALTVAFLERIEALLSERDGKEIRLGDYFDLVGGTSTGAVIAGALALGLPHGASERLLSQAGAVCLQAPALARAAVAGEVRRPRLAPPDRGSGRRPRAAKHRPDHRLLHHHQAHGYRQPLDHLE